MSQAERFTGGSAVAEAPRDARRQFRSCQLLRNSVSEQVSKSTSKAREKITVHRGRLGVQLKHMSFQ